MIEPFSGVCPKCGQEFLLEELRTALMVVDRLHDRICELVKADQTNHEKHHHRMPGADWLSD